MGLLRATITSTTLAVTLGVVNALPTRITFVEPPASPESGETSLTVKVETLIEENACWTSSDPATDTIPGHVIYAKSDEKDSEPRVGGKQKTHEALEQVFTDDDYNLVVYAFCP